MANDMYDTYDNEDIAYDYPYSFSDTKKDYMKNLNEPNVSFFFGDTIEFEIDLFNYDLFLSEEEMSSASLYIEISSFRNERVYSEHIDFDDYVVTIKIDSDKAQSSFKKGLYNCSIKLETEDCTKTIVANYLIRIK